MALSPRVPLSPHRCLVAGILAALAGGCDALTRAPDDRADFLAHPDRCLPGDRDPDRNRDRDREREASRLLASWAPTFIQHVARRDAGRDRPTRVDFDGDWDARNKWRNQAEAGASLPPTVYGAAVLTEARAYLFYTLYYPRDWMRPICLPYLCHDNDLENVLVVAEREGPLVFLETKAHLSYHGLSGDEVALDGDGRPLVWVEAGGHGPHPCPRGDPACRAERGRLVYTPKASGDRTPNASGDRQPRRAEGQKIGYELESLRDTLWARRHIEPGRGLWTAGETGPLYYRGARCGRLGRPMGASMAYRVYPGGVRPPWALEGSRGARGDWFFDPAAFALPPGQGPSPGAKSAPAYVFHPFLSDLRGECVGDECARPAAAREPTRLARWLGMGLLAALFALALQRSQRRLSRLSEGQRSARRTRER